MYRSEKDRAHQRRAAKLFKNVRSYWDWLLPQSNPEYNSLPRGYFRKSNCLGCPTGRKCLVCKTTELSRQQQRADIDYAEQIKEYNMTFR